MWVCWIPLQIDSKMFVASALNLMLCASILTERTADNGSILRTKKRLQAANTNKSTALSQFFLLKQSWRKETRNPAHRRPWLKMKIEYHPALIFCAFVRGFLKFQVYTLFVAEFHWKVSKMAFSPQRNDNFNAFLKWRNYFVYARICFFFSSSDSINPAAGGLPSVPKIRSSVASTYVGKVHER